MKPDPAIGPLARAIAEGVRVDWESAASAAPDDATRRFVRQLAVIAAIAEVHSPTTTVGEEPASTASSPAEDLRTWGPFHLLERIGRGAYGEVYRALDTRLNREVALKLLPTDVSGENTPASSTIREGSLLARVRHPNVVDIHGAEQIGDRIGLWMEFVKGETLEQILEQCGSLSEAEAAAIGIQVCRAVSAVHGVGLIHRDIKAQNVMRAADGRIVLLDFGAGWMVETDSASDFAGTPLYLAPEVLRGEPATAQSDIYSTGVLLYRLVAGSFPIHGRTMRELRRRHEQREPTPIRQVRPDVSAQFARTIDRAIDPDPTKRFRTPDAFEAELAKVRRPGQRRVAFAGGVVAAVTAALVGWGAVNSGIEQERRPSRTPEEDGLVRGRTLLARRGLPSAQQAAEVYEQALPAIPTRLPLTPVSPRLTHSCRSRTVAFRTTRLCRSCSGARLRHSP